MAAPLDVTVRRLVSAPPEAVRRVMFDPEQDPGWMAAVTSVARLTGGDEPGGRVRRTGRFMGRTLRWTTEVESASSDALDLRIVDGPMRGTVSYRIAPSGEGSEVSIRNTGTAPGFAPRALMAWAMRRALTADLRRLAQLVESTT